MIRYLKRPTARTARWVWDYIVSENGNKPPLRLLYHSSLKEWEAEFHNGTAVSIKAADITQGKRKQKMPRGSAVAIKGVWLRRSGEYAIVTIESVDGREVEIIREHMESNFSHNVSEHGLRAAVGCSRD